jgi:hypothetical protein
MAALVSGGCSPSQPVGSEPQDSTLVLPTQGDDPTMTPLAMGLQRLIEKAKDDLAKRLSITVAEISVVEAGEVVWPDASLGCPKMGVMYAQTLTPGFLITLEAGGQQYFFHTDEKSTVVLCIEDNLPDFPLTPGQIQDGKPWMPVN